MDWPKIWLIFATYKRTAAALTTIESLGRYLKYPNVHFHIASDGSGETDDGTGRRHVDVMAGEAVKWFGDVTAHEMETPPGQFNTGGNINEGIHQATADGADIHILVFDDWALFRELDLKPMVDVLDTHSQVGFVRLSYYVPGNAGLMVGYDLPRLGGEHMFFRLIRDWSLRNPWHTDTYTVSTQPYIAHRRFFEAYGYHPEHVNPGIAECNLGTQYNISGLGENGPQILWYIGPGVVHAPWAHLVGRAHDYAKV